MRVLFGLHELSYIGFCQATLDIEMTSLRVVDDNGNVWGCTLMYGTDDGGYFKIGGSWKRMVLARRLRQGSRILLGAPVAGKNEVLYLRVIRIYEWTICLVCFCSQSKLCNNVGCSLF